MKSVLYYHILQTGKWDSVKLCDFCKVSFLISAWVNSHSQADLGQRGCLKVLKYYKNWQRVFTLEMIKKKKKIPDEQNILPIVS